MVHTLIRERNEVDRPSKVSRPHKSVIVLKWCAVVKTFGLCFGDDVVGASKYVAESTMYEAEDGSSGLGKRVFFVE